MKNVLPKSSSPVVGNNWEGEGQRGWQRRQQRWGAGAIHKNLGFGAPWVTQNCKRKEAEAVKISSGFGETERGFDCLEI